MMKRFFRLQNILIIVLLLADCLLLRYLVATSSIDIPVSHIDGAFQTASALYRLADGQLPGRDFFPYLGIGLVYVNYPLFMLMGGHISASLFSAHYVTGLSFLISVGLIAALVFRRQPVLVGVVAGSMTLAGISLIYFALPLVAAAAFVPGNSLRPLRAFLPYAIVAVIYCLLYFQIRPRWLYGGIGVLAGASLLWSNDYAFSTMGSLILFAWYLAYTRRQMTLTRVIAVPLIAVATAFFLLWLVTAGHVFDLLHYNFFDVGRNQFWYFAPWTSESRIWSLSDLPLKMIIECNLICGDLVFGLFSDKQLPVWWVAPAYLCWRYYRHRAREDGLLLLLGVMLAGGGLLATVGGHLGYYLVPFVLWCLLISFFLLLFWLKQGMVYAGRRLVIKIPSVAQTLFVSLLLLVLLLVLVWRIVDVRTILIEHYRYRKTSPEYFYVEELGGYLPADNQDYVAAIRSSSGKTVLEEYWSLWSAITRRAQTLSVDAIIHAMGDTRQHYQAAIEALPDRVTTLRSKTYGGWQRWNLSANWWFYKTLIEHYVPEAASPQILIWRRPADSSRLAYSKPVACYVINDKARPFIELANDEPGFYEVTLRYDNNSRKRRLLMVRNNINDIFTVAGYLAFDPHASEVVFPAWVREKGEHRLGFLEFSATSGDFSGFAVLSCQAKRYTFSDLSLLELL